MKASIAILLYFFFLSAGFSQDCNHNNLSDKYKIEIYTKWYGSVRHTLGDSLDITVIVTNKVSQVRQQINFGSRWMSDASYSDCNNVRSYITGVNKYDIAEDNDYGDIIVADFNFDKKDDVAFKRNMGGNGGPPYIFYIQDDKGVLVRDVFLTEIMEYFPSEINAVNQKLVTLVHANAYSMGKTTYKYSTKTKKWKNVSHTYVP
jgi:hypothetical protein